jgi:hypothetical protein
MPGPIFLGVVEEEVPQGRDLSAYAGRQRRGNRDVQCCFGLYDGPSLQTTAGADIEGSRDALEKSPAHGCGDANGDTRTMG